MRRGYEPVDDGDQPRGGDDSLRSDYAPIPPVDVSSTAEDGVEAPQLPTNVSESPKESTDKASDGMKVRILDVQGQTYWVTVAPDMTVRELKAMLEEVAGVETARQRIIFGGKVRARMITRFIPDASRARGRRLVNSLHGHHIGFAFNHTIFILRLASCSRWKQDFISGSPIVLN